LRDLEKVDADRARAIVKLANRAVAGRKGAAAEVDIVQVAKNVGLVIVGSTRALRKIPFLHLVEVAPLRFLLALKPGNDFRSLEIAINDLLEDLPEEEQEEKGLLTKLVDSIKEMRKSDRVTMAEILLLNLESDKKR
jgi:hypothetical protein